MPDRLSMIEQQTLLELGRKGSGGNFDHVTMSKLFTMELVEIRNSDRRLVLTKAGREMYRDLAKRPTR